MSPHGRRILEHMLNNRQGLSVKECFSIVGTTELRKEVSMLKAAGWKIDSEFVKGVDGRGYPVRFKKYFLTEEGMEEAKEFFKK